jgi:CO/xanthine dehydrogenase FAD-binding subunit
LKHFRQYLKARTVEEALALRRDIGPKSLFIAGGTSVVPFGGRGADVLIDITGLGLHGTTDHGDLVALGGTMRLAELLHPDFRKDLPAIHRAASMVGSPPLRNMATVGGSLAGIFLPSDIGIAMLAMGARIHLKGEEERAVLVDDLLAGGWLSGYDLVTEVRVEKTRAGKGTGFAKFGRSNVDISLVNAAATLTISDGVIGDLRLAVGQTGSKPVLLAGPGLGAEGRGVTVDVVRDLAEKAAGSVKPKADSRASADFRKSLMKVMIARAISEAVSQAGGRLAD